MDTPTQMDATTQTFEAALAELEQIVKTLESGELTLERALALFERGVELSRFCHGRLDEAEKRIEILTDRGEVRQAPASLEPAPDEGSR